jgi:hypothetical protein
MTISIPEEPETLAIWRQIAARRDELVSRIRDWERKDHPAMRDLVKISKLYGSHGHTERHLLELDQEALARAQHHKDELDVLDGEVAVAMRDDKNRGSSLEQLRELVEPQKAREKAARAALKRWWNADTWLTRYAVTRALSDLGVLVPEDQLGLLKEDDLKFRRADAGAPSGNLDAKVGRTLQRLLAPPRPRETCAHCGGKIRDLSRAELELLEERHGPMDGTRACVNPDCIVGVRVE